MAWLPADYKAPVGELKHTKFLEGKTKIRVLSEPIVGYEYWVELPDGSRKPKRTHELREVVDALDYVATNPDGSANKAKHFWAFIVWNYDAAAIQICHITQTSIREAITNLITDEDWGDVREYDLAITRTGKGLDTEYHVTPSNKGKTDIAILLKAKETPVYLEALYDGADPFTVSDTATTAKAPQNAPQAATDVFEKLAEDKEQEIEEIDMKDIPFN